MTNKQADVHPVAHNKPLESLMSAEAKGKGITKLNPSFYTQAQHLSHINTYFSPYSPQIAALAGSTGSPLSWCLMTLPALSGLWTSSAVNPGAAALLDEVFTCFWTEFWYSWCCVRTETHRTALREGEEGQRGGDRAGWGAGVWCQPHLRAGTEGLWSRRDLSLQPPGPRQWHSSKPQLCNFDSPSGTAEFWFIVPQLSCVSVLEKP